MDRQSVFFGIAVLALLVLFGMYFSSLSSTVARPRLYVVEDTYSYTLAPMSFDSSMDDADGPRCGFADFDGDGKMDYYCYKIAFGDSPASPNYLKFNVVIDYASGSQQSYLISKYISHLDDFGSYQVVAADADGDGKAELYVYFVDDWGSYNCAGIARWKPSLANDIQVLSSYCSSSVDYGWHIGIVPVPATVSRDYVFSGYARWGSSAYWYYLWGVTGTANSAAELDYAYNDETHESVYRSVGTDQSGNPVWIKFYRSRSTDYMYFGTYYCYKNSSPECTDGGYSSVSMGAYAKSNGELRFWKYTIVGTVSSVPASYDRIPVSGFLPEGSVYYGKYWKQDYVHPIDVNFPVDYLSRYAVATFRDTDHDGLREFHVCSAGDGEVTCTIYGAPEAAPGFEASALDPLDYDHGVEEVNIAVRNGSIVFADANYYWYLDGELVSTSGDPEFNIPVTTPGTHTLTLIINTDSSSYTAESDINVPAVPWDVHIYKHVSAPYGENNTVRDVNLCATAEDDTPDDLSYHWVISANLSSWTYEDDGNCIHFQIDLNDFSDPNLTATVVVTDPDGYSNSASGTFDATVVDDSSSGGGTSTHATTSSAPSGYTQVAAPTTTESDESQSSVSLLTVVAVVSILALVVYVGVRKH